MFYSLVAVPYLPCKCLDKMKPKRAQELIQEDWSFTRPKLLHSAQSVIHFHAREINQFQATNAPNVRRLPLPNGPDQSQPTLY